MPHSTVLLAVASHWVEAAVNPGRNGSHGPAPSRVLAQGESLAAGMAALAGGGEWAASSAVVVVATESVGFRKLAFPFKDPRRVRQSLHYGLETELLEPVDAYAVDYESIPSGEGVQLLVSLLKQDLLGELLGAAAHTGLQTYRVLSSAQALLAATRPAAPDCIQVYVGAEEAFLTVLRGGHLDQIVALPSALNSVLAELGAQGLAQPRDVERLLGGQSDESRVDRTLLRTRLQNELHDLAAQIGRYLRVQPLPAGAVCSVYGLYSPWIHVDPVEGTASYTETPHPAGPPRTALGILHELCQAPDGVLSEKGPGFFRAASSWRSIVGEVRRPAIALAVMLALALITGIGTYAARTLSLQHQLDRTHQDLEALLERRVGGNVPESARESVLREQLASLRQQAQIAARATTTPYAILNTFTDISSQAAAMTGISVDSVQINPTQVTLTGQTPSYQAAEALRDKFGAMPRFKGRTAKLTYTRAGDSISYRLTVQ